MSLNIKVLAIVNPASGKGNITEKIEEIKQNLEAKDMTVDIIMTEVENNAKQILLTYEKEKDLILICGGDGTLNETVTAMMEKKEEVSLCYIPFGTTNDLAKSLNMPIRDISITNKILEAKARKIDIGKVNEDKYFCYVAAFGVITDVAYKTSQKAKNKYGRLAYYMNAIKGLRRIPTYKMQIRYGDKHIEDEFMYGGISNSESIAGFKWFEKGEIQLDDGDFEGIFIRKPKSIFGYFKILGSFLRKEYNENKYIVFIQAKEIQIKAEKEIDWTIDGEFAGALKEVKIENCKQAVEFVICEKEK